MRGEVHREKQEEGQKRRGGEERSAKGETRGEQEMRERECEGCGSDGKAVKIKSEGGGRSESGVRSEMRAEGKGESGESKRAQTLLNTNVLHNKIPLLYRLYIYVYISLNKHEFLSTHGRLSNVIVVFKKGYFTMWA